MQKKINYLRVVLTHLCNLSCSYCHKEGAENSPHEVMSPEFMIKMLRCFHGAGIRKFKMMGGDPTLYAALPEVLRGISFADSDISMITNGMFDRSFLERCFGCGLQRVNVSVHAWSDERRMTASGMTGDMLRTLRSNLQFLADTGRLSKVNYVLLNSLGYDELFDLIVWISENQQVLDILNVISTNGKELHEDFLPFSEIISLLEKRYSFDEVYVKKNPYNPDSLRIILKGGGAVNLKIFPLNSIQPFNSCRTCREISRCSEGIKAIRLICGGYIQPCLLRRDNRMDIATWEAKDESEITRLLVKYIEEL